MKNKLSECQKTLLAMLKFNNPERYKEKLENLGANETDLTDYFAKEKERIYLNSKIKKAVFPKRQFNVLPQIKRRSVRSVNNQTVTKSIYILVDGDNNPRKNMEGYKEAVKMKGVTIIAFVADKGLQKIYKTEFGLATKLVPAGSQAVDKRIKSIAGIKAKNHEYDHIVIVSGDQGYREKIKQWKKDYKWHNEKIRLCKNLAGAIRIS